LQRKTKKSFTNILPAWFKTGTQKCWLYIAYQITSFIVGFKPVLSIADFVKEIKVESNEFINEKKWVKGKFSWQEGYGVFSYSHSHIGAVINYIKNQEAHHQKSTFKHEYHELLEKFEIPFEEKYLFNFMEPSVQEAPDGAK
jgi:hypothetical protein